MSCRQNDGCPPLGGLAALRAPARARASTHDGKAQRSPRVRVVVPANCDTDRARQRPIPARSDRANGLVQNPSEPHGYTRLEQPRRSNSPFSRQRLYGRLPLSPPRSPFRARPTKRHNPSRDVDSRLCPVRLSTAERRRRTRSLELRRPRGQRRDRRDGRRHASLPRLRRRRPARRVRRRRSRLIASRS
jgi:hypothetical protein